MLRKTIKNWQMGVTSTIFGTAFFPSILGQMLARALLVDNHGRLIVRVAGPAGFPPFTCENPVSVQEQSEVLTREEQVVSGESVLSQFFGYSDSGAARWAQIHDSAVALVSGVSIPSITVPVPAGSAYSVSTPWVFANGIRVAMSSTGPVWTDPGVDEMWWNVLGANCPPPPAPP